MPFFLSSADFFKINFKKLYFRNDIKMSNSLFSVNTRRFVGPLFAKVIGVRQNWSVAGKALNESDVYKIVSF